MGDSAKLASPRTLRSGDAPGRPLVRRSPRPLELLEPEGEPVAPPLEIGVSLDRARGSTDARKVCGKRSVAPECFSQGKIGSPGRYADDARRRASADRPAI